MMQSVLIVEDEPAIRELISLYLTQAGFHPMQAVTAEDARFILRTEKPDLIIIDWMLPGMSGFDLARFLRRDQETKNIPIIMLTAKHEEEDKIKGLEAGADDYITKPFSPRELMARIKALLRRQEMTLANEKIEFGGLTLDPIAHRVTAKGELIDLGPTEFRLLHFFMMNPERVHSRAQVLDHVWGSHVVVEDRTVDVHIRRLRRALEAKGCADYIQTVRGIGYRFAKT
jgi:two-component system phosphate regulon response regulator PhoB